jgi:hypothetical protein
VVDVPCKPIISLIHKENVMSIQKFSVLPLALILLAATSLSWAATFDCAVYDMKINNGQGSAARQADIPVDADTSEAAEASIRADNSIWQDASQYVIKCREVKEEE